MKVRRALQQSWIFQHPNPIGSMGLVYSPTWMVDFWVFMEVNIPAPWNLWVMEMSQMSLLWTARVWKIVILGVETSTSLVKKGWTPRCCFKYLLFSSPGWGDDPIWLIFFKWVGSTTNQVRFQVSTRVDPWKLYSNYLVSLGCFTYLGDVYPTYLYRGYNS